MTTSYFITEQGSGKTNEYKSAHAAGAAYFEADATTRPSVVQTLDNGKVGRFFANIEIHGNDANGEKRLVKSMPNENIEGAKEFRTGYFEALEKSVNKRLQGVNWEKAKPDDLSTPPILDPKLYNDLKDLSNVDNEKAAKLWTDHAPEWAQVSTIVPVEKNVVQHEPERQIDVEDAKMRVNRMREIERHKYEQDQLGQQAEGKRIKFENLSEKVNEQNDENRLAERVGAESDYNSQNSTEREKNRQAEMIDQVHHQFHVSGNKFHFKDQPNKVAFTDKGPRMVSASNDERVAHAMATMAEAKGWKTIRVSGHPDFQREVWMEASLRGLEVRGFIPQEKDLKELNTRLERRSKNTVEREPDHERQQKPQKTEHDNAPPQERRQESQQAADKGKSPIAPEKTAGEALRAYAGRILEHGEAPYNYDPKEKPNYFVKLSTDKGEETVWGVDLKRAIAVSKTHTGDDIRLEFRGKQPVTVTTLERDKTGKVIGSKEIETNRNAWEVQKSDRQKVVEAVAAEVINKKFNDPAQREAAMKAINQQLDERSKIGKVPTVPMYDKAAPSTTQQPDRARPPVERNAERTR